MIHKVVLSAAMIGAALTPVSVGAFASFVATNQTASSKTTGTVSLSPIDVNTPTNQISTGTGDLAPGDTVESLVHLASSGTLDLSAVELTTTAAPSSALDTNLTHGLHILLERCSTPWTEDQTGPSPTYTCPATIATVLDNRPIIGSRQILANLDLHAGADNYLRVTLSLPATADNTLEGNASTINYAFTATQRTSATR